MRIRSTRSTRRRNTKSGKRVLLALCYLAAWAIVPLVALWPVGDPHPKITAMHLAVGHGNLAAIDESLRGGLDVDSPDDTGITPLMTAARVGHLDATRKLLAAGANINACAGIFGTPLIIATSRGNHAVMRELIERNANVHAVNSNGQTALWYARTGEDAEAARILIAAGAIAEGRCAARPAK